jgi:hypothetical protein
MIVTYKHIRHNGKLIATKCNIQESCEGETSPIGIGYAICSDRDMFSRKIGRDISLKRAMKALLSKRNTLPIRRMDSYNVDYFGKKTWVYFKSIYWDLNKEEK